MPVALRPIEFEILLTLAHGERHGYAIIQETEARSGGTLVLETGTLYRALRRLVDTGLVKPAARRTAEDCDDASHSDDERRRYYAITARGRRAASDEAVRMARLVSAARAVNLLPRAAGA
jgi:DNA-binding PadR family transcriptional regulator